MFYMKPLTRVNKDDIPKLVQSYKKTQSDWLYRVVLFDGTTVFVNMSNVRESILPGFNNWDEDIEDMALEQYMINNFNKRKTGLFI